jgi:hypothetical protein
LTNLREALHDLGRIDVGHEQVGRPPGKWCRLVRGPVDGMLS